MKWIKNVFFKQKQKQKQKRRYNFVELGFHGDTYLLQLIDFLVSNDVGYFIETGTNVGSTLTYFAKKYPTIQCFSCEPDKPGYDLAVKHTNNLENVNVFNELSEDFLQRLKTKNSNLFQEKTLFWLDAHGSGFTWPLKTELAFILKNFNHPYILIDDFKVPHLPQFGYDAYENQECSLEFIEPVITKDIQVYFPNYTKKTSLHHPLRGWGLLLKDKETVMDNFQNPRNILRYQ